MTGLLSNWKTSVAGLVPLLTGVMEAGAGLAQMLHIAIPGVTVTGDPFSMITTGLPMIATGLGLFLARDFNVSSEKSGAK